MSVCKQCGREVSGDEIGLTKKLINRSTEEFMCLPCLAKYFSCDEEILRRKIEEYRKIGCTLFPSKG